MVTALHIYDANSNRLQSNTSEYKQSIYLLKYIRLLRAVCFDIMILRFVLSVSKYAFPTKLVFNKC